MTGNFRNFGLAVVVAAVALASEGVAKPLQPAKRVAMRSGPSASLSAKQTRRSNPGSTELSAGLGLYANGFATGLLVNLGAMFRVSDSVPVYVGVDTFIAINSYGGYGGNYGPYDYRSYLRDYSPSTTSVAVGVLGSGYYDFQLNGAPNLHILAGASLGPVFGYGGVGFAFLMRPGFRIDLNRSLALTIEPVLGVIGGGFGFFPRALLNVKI